MKGVTIGNFKVWHNKIGYSNILGLKHKIIPRRLTLKCNPPIYQWLWFAFSFVDLNKWVEEHKKGDI